MSKVLNMEGLPNLELQLDSAVVGRLIEAAVAAPSPDNNQPWAFFLRNGRLRFFLDTSRALPSDVHHMFDLLSAGAALENLKIAASDLGLESRILILDPSDYDKSQRYLPAAEVTFTQGAKSDPLAPAISLRCTDRSLYRRIPIDSDRLQRLHDAAADFRDVSLFWIAEREQLRRLATIVASADRFRFEYPAFHAEIYRQLRLTAEEAEHTRDGLDVRTLGLPLGGKLIIRCLKSWTMMQLFNRLGLSRLLTVPSALGVTHSSAVGALFVSTPTLQAFVAAGRAFQRLWLQATLEGIALHPLGSLSILIAHQRLLSGKRLQPRHIALAQRLDQQFQSLLSAQQDIAERTLVLLFRIGFGRPPRVRSLRRHWQQFSVQIGG